VNAGTAATAVLNFVLPRGAVGPEGPTGPQGEEGPIGPMGDVTYSTVAPPDINTAGSAGNNFVAVRGNHTHGISAATITGLLNGNAGVTTLLANLFTNNQTIQNAILAMLQAVGW
jgi:hypothetical protein